MLLLGLWFILGLSTILDGTEESSMDDYLASFSSKTAYRNSKLAMQRDSVDEDSKCTLVHMNSLFRHGTRHPSEKEIRHVEQVHENIIKSEKRRDISEAFLNWKSPFSYKEEKDLSPVGYEEMINLGERFRERLNRIGGSINYTRDVVAFSTSVARSKYSGTMFMKQFLPKEKSFEEVSSMIKEKDTELRFFDNCPYYTSSVAKNKSAIFEYKRFAKGPLIRKIIKEFHKKWNFKDVNLTADDVRALYVMCGYEIANNISANMKVYRCDLAQDKGSLECPYPISVTKQRSPLCDILERHHFDVFDYLYDLKHYWIKSYGRRINWLQSCDLMMPMLEYITSAAKGHRSAEKSSDYFRAVFWFAHAETILPLAALLNIFNQSLPMTAESFRERLKMIADKEQMSTTFRVSNIAPFGGNLGLELHHCPHLMKGDKDGYVVRVRSNEKTLPWSLAGGKTDLPLDAFVEHLQMCLPHNYKREDLCHPR